MLIIVTIIIVRAIMITLKIKNVGIIATVIILTIITTISKIFVRASHCNSKRQKKYVVITISIAIVMVVVMTKIQK